MADPESLEGGLVSIGSRYQMLGSGVQPPATKEVLSFIDIQSNEKTQLISILSCHIVASSLLYLVLYNYLVNCYIHV